MTGQERYDAALAWLLSFSDWERGVGWNPDAAPDEQWKLGRTRALLDLAGAPDRRLRTVLVAGTKGKGSTAAFLESMARAGGWRTGLYSQPHLHSYRERIALDGRPISPGRFAALADRLRPLVERFQVEHPRAGQPTTFELTTVLAVLAFAEADVNLQVLEVGLGGRLDATNAVDPLLSVITPIGLDHTQILGATIDLIAREKAGIVRPNGVVVSARQRPAARREIAARCREVGARCRFVAPLATERSGTATTDVGGGQYALVRLRPGGPPVPVSLGLIGAHQRQNAAVALAAAGELTRHGFTLDAAAVRTGFAATHLPGRVEVVAGRPMTVVDGAHNPDSAAALARALLDLGFARPRWFVLGILRDKDARAILGALQPLVDGVVAVAPASPRALPADRLADVCRRAGILTVVTAAGVEAGLRCAREAAGPSGTVVATGSFAVVSEARAALGLAGSEG